MRISKIDFVTQMAKKVFSVENGFGMEVTKKGLEVGSKRVLHFEDVGDRNSLVTCDGPFGVGVLGFRVSNSYI